VAVNIVQFAVPMPCLHEHPCIASLCWIADVHRVKYGQRDGQRVPDEHAVSIHHGDAGQAQGRNESAELLLTALVFE